MSRRVRIALRWLAVLAGMGLAGLAMLLVYGVHMVDAAMASPGTAAVVVRGRPLLLRSGDPWSADDLRAALLRRGVREVGGDPGRAEFSQQGSVFRLGARLLAEPDSGVIADAGRAGLRLAAEGRELPQVLIRGPVIGTRATADVVRWPVPLDAIAPELVTAVVDVEDRTFASHGGLSLRGVVRAALRDLLAGGVREGGSTINQQLAKMLMLRPARTVPRKVLEAWLATLIDFRYRKHEILEAYLNRIYLGQDGGWQIQGVAAAAQFYFGKHHSELEPDEATLLAGLIAAPNRFDPFTRAEAAQGRRRVVLQAMTRAGHLDAARVEALATRPLPQAPRRLRWPPAGQALESILGEAAGEMDVASSLDSDVQAALAEALPAAIGRLEVQSTRLQELALAGDRLQVAAVVLGTDGQILGMMGSRTGTPGELNRALAARRPIGSLVKPFVVALAMAQGWTPESLLEDTPVQVQVNTQVWAPQNHDRKFRGPITVREALVHSRNVPMVRLGMAIGPPMVAESLRGLGFAVGQPHPAILLGAFEGSPLQVARGYAALLAQGRLCAPSWQAEAAPPGAQVIDAAAAAAVVTMLEDVPRQGTAASLAGRVEGWLAGKTGTSDERRDSWFVALRRGYVTVVWVGTDGNAQTGLSGATGALEIWREFDARLPRVRRLGDEK